VGDAGSTSSVDLVEAHRRAGLLSPSSVHLARTLDRLAPGLTPEATLAVAYAAEAPLQGDTAVDLTRIAQDAQSDAVGTSAFDDLVWPDPERWLAAVAACPLVQGDTPAVVVRGPLVFLGRYDGYERRVAQEVAQRAVSDDSADPGPLRVADHLLSGEGAPQQQEAVRQGVSRTLSIITGGPGTGKTTTVAALLAEVIARSPQGGVRPRVALAAPTGKAAARLGEALRDLVPVELADLLAVVAEAPCSTLHRLIGWSTRGEPRHHRANPVPYDLVIIDETSMVSLPLMARVLDALRPDARLVLVGDPGQLASVEAGTVLSDLVAGAQRGPLAGCITELVVSHRYPAQSPLDLLAKAVRSGDSAAAIEAMGAPPAAEGRGGITWIEAPGTDPGVRRQLAVAVDPYIEGLVGCAVAGDGQGALDALRRLRVLCAHRHGPFGVGSWNQWIRERIPRRIGVDGDWYAGRPVMVTSNDPSTGLFNGDVGVVVHTGGRTMVAFEATAAGGGLRLMSPARLERVETVHAMTIHKSQGSEFGHVVVVLPPPDSRLASRDLLYTAITRATHHLTLVGDRASVEQAVGRRTSRTSGLAERLTGTDQAPAGPREVP